MPLAHAIETGWSPNPECCEICKQSIRAYCRNCQTWFSGYCSDPTDYMAIRRAEQEARKPFADFPCFADGEADRS